MTSDTDKPDFKAALEWVNGEDNRYQMMSDSAGPPKIEHPWKKKIQDTKTALQIADRLQNGDLKYEILEQAIDEMGWEEINAFNNQKGQSIYEDAGGYLIRKIKCLFGVYPEDEIETYKDAARRLVAEAKINGRTTN